MAVLHQVASETCCAVLSILLLAAIVPSGTCLRRVEQIDESKSAANYHLFNRDQGEARLLQRKQTLTEEDWKLLDWNQIELPGDTGQSEDKATRTSSAVNGVALDSLVELNDSLTLRNTLEATPEEWLMRIKEIQMSIKKKYPDATVEQIQKSLEKDELLKRLVPIPLAPFTYYLKDSDSLQIPADEKWTKNLKLVKQLGKGSYGIVYKMKVACAKADEAQAIALKVQEYKDKVTIDEETKKTKLMSFPWNESPYVLSLAGGTTHGVHVAGGKIFYLLELMNSGEFFDLVNDNAPEYGIVGGRAAAIGLMLHVLKGLKVLHQQGIIHMDMKLENAMVNCEQVEGRPHCFAQVIDLGLTMQRGNPDGDGFRGTPGMIAPELLIQDSLGQKPDAQPANDVYAVGYMLYQVYFQADPSYYDHDGTSFEIMANQLKWHPDMDHNLRCPNTSVLSKTSKEKKKISRIICGMMDPNPSARWDVDKSLVEIKSFVMWLAEKEVMSGSHPACSAGTQVHRVKSGIRSLMNKCLLPPVTSTCPRRTETYCYANSPSFWCCCEPSFVKGNRTHKEAGGDCGKKAGGTNIIPTQEQRVMRAQAMMRLMEGMDRDPVDNKARKPPPLCLH